MSTKTPISSWALESLNSFLEQLSLSKSKPTVDAYKYDVERFLEYLAYKGIKKLALVKPDHIISYLGYCKQGGKSDASITRYYMAIRNYCRYLRKTGMVDRDLTEDITPPMNRPTAPYVPSMQEVARILEQPNTSTESGLRDRAILELLYSSGLRASELCDLELRDVGANQVLVSCGKRGKTRSVPMNGFANTWIAQYIQQYRGTQAGYLFLTKMRRQLRRQLLSVIVCTYAEKAGIKGVTTHTLRHACATHLLDKGADLRLIQEVLGHSSIASTQRYTHLSTNKIQEMFQHFHPRCSNET